MFKYITTAMLSMVLGVAAFAAPTAEPVVKAPAKKAAVAAKAVKKDCKKAVKKACPKAAAKDCKACPEAAAKKCTKAVKECGKAILPKCAQKDAANSDAMVSWYKDSKGYFYLVYDWKNLQRSMSVPSPGAPKCSPAAN